MTQTISMPMMAQPDTVLRSPLGHLIEFDIDDEITSPSEWKQEIRAIRDAGQNDVLKIRLCTPGGRLDTTLEFLSALRQTEATKVMELTGPVASAGTMIFLCGDEFIVNDGIEFMIHQPSGGAIGGMRQINDHVTHMAKQCDKLVREVYQGFCTTEEIEEILKGVELWLDAEQVAERLNKRAEYMNTKNSELDEQYLTEDKEYLNKLDKDTLISLLCGEEVDLPEEDSDNPEDVPETSQYKQHGKFALDTWSGDIIIPDPEVECHTHVFDYEGGYINDLKLAKEFATVIGIEFHKSANKGFMSKKLCAWVESELMLEE